MPDYWVMVIPIIPILINLLVTVGFVVAFRLRSPDRVIDRIRAAQTRKLAAETLARIDALIELNDQFTTPCPCTDCGQEREKRRSMARDTP
jgi:hypothetical protein